MSYPLYDFAYIPKIDDRLSELERLSLAENWNYRHTPNPRPLPILFSYLHYTFIRLEEEGKVAITPERDKAAFNCGLVTENQEDIYAVFYPNKTPPPDWYFRGFFKRNAHELMDFSPLPPPANYFMEPAELIYDTRLELRPDIDHIIDENIDRFPESLKEMNDNHRLRITFEGAINDAVQRVRRNYKAAVPQYYQGRIQLLLPMYLTDRTHADLALVVYKQGNVYRASTCLTLDMAYNNARLLAKLDADWLDP